MARTAAKIILSPSRDIPLDRLILSQSNVRRTRAGVSIETLADDIARRGLLQSLSVRPLLDAEGEETGRYEVPAGGRRFRALELLVRRKLLAKNAPVPCIVKAADHEILAEDDSLAENAMREALHPLDQFRAMQAMIEKGEDVDAVAANFFVTPAVVRQRLKLASVSPVLHEAYADDRIGLEQLMAFTISDDFNRQVQVFELLTESRSLAPHLIRQKLTENVVRAADKRARFVTADAYVAAGGGIVRDLFEADGGGWLTDPALLDRLVDEKLKAEGERLLHEGWKWVVTSVELPWDALRDHREIDRNEVPMTAEEEARIAQIEAEGEEIDRLWSDCDEVPGEIHARVDAINAEYTALLKRPLTFAPEDIAIAGVFLSIERDGSIRIDRGYVRPEDEPVDEEVEVDEEGSVGDGAMPANTDRGTGVQSPEEPGEGDATEELKPLPDRLVSDLTAWRTLALQDALAQDPATAYLAVLHAFVLGCFYSFSRESCLQVAASRVYFSNAPANLRDCAPAAAIDARGAGWKGRLPKSDKDLWDHLVAMGDEDRAKLLAHCASVALNAQAEIVPKYDNGRISAHGVARRIAHSNILARAVGLDVHAAGWRPTEGGYFRSVTKPRILADVAEARGPQFAEMIDHLKKADMAREAERLLEDTDWLPETIEAEARRLNRFVSNLLDMVRVEAGALPMKVEATDLFDAAASAAHDTRASLAGHEVKVDISPNIPLVRVDPVLLHHCLINLLDNAGRYADPGTPITIRARRTADAIELSVIDRGPGIAPGNKKRVFETFTRLEGSDRAKHGTGLGLAIVKGFAEAMGLTVAASNNEEPHGACFTIRVPEALIITNLTDKDIP